MISHLRGRVDSVYSDYVVIDVNGVGYTVFVTAGALSNLSMDSDVTLKTSMVVKEDSVTLYGFKDETERDLFRLLCDVSGIGPRTAVAILSTLSVDTLALAIAEADLKVISSVSGIGKKTAERIALELRDKIKPFVSSVSVSGTVKTDVVTNFKGRYTSDAVAALMSLGYSQSESEQAVKSALLDTDTQDASKLVKVALVKLSSGRI